MHERQPSSVCRLQQDGHLVPTHRQRLSFLSARQTKVLVALVEEIATGPSGSLPWKFDLRPVKFLQGVPQRWTVLLHKDVPAKLDPVVGSDAHEERAESGVMDLAHRDAVGHHWLAAEGVAPDVSGIQ